MDLLSLEPKSTQNLLPTCFSSLTFITFLHKLYTLAKVGKSSYMLCFDSSESSGILFFSMFICAILPILLPPESCPDPSGSDDLITVQPSKAQSISYFKSCLQNICHWSTAVPPGQICSEASFLCLSMPTSCQMAWEGAGGLDYGHRRTRTMWPVQGPALLVFWGSLQ